MRKTLEQRIESVRAYLTDVREAADMTIDRVTNPGDYAADVMRALDFSAIDGLRGVANNEALFLELDAIVEDIRDLQEENNELHQELRAATRGT